MNRTKSIFLTALMLLTLGATEAFAISKGTKPENGNGTSRDPYQITNAEELRWFAREINNAWFYTSDYCILMNDIDLSSVCGPSLGSWIPIGCNEKFNQSANEFKGGIDGNGYTIRGLYINNQRESENFRYYAGLIGTCSNVDVHNLTVEGTIVPTADFNGGIIGVIYSGGTPRVENCVSRVNFLYDGDIEMPFSVGGVIGTVYPDNMNIKNCHYKGKMYYSYRTNYSTFITGSYLNSLNMAYGAMRGCGAIVGNGMKYLHLSNCSSSGYYYNEDDYH